MEHHTLLAANLLLVVRVNKERDEDSVGAHRRLDDVRDVALIGLGIEIREVATAVLHMRLEVEVGAIGDSLELAPPEWIVIFDVACRGAVVRELFLRVRAEAEIRFAHAHLVDVPAHPLGAPVLVQLPVTAWLAEVLHLHQLEFAQSEDEVPGRDLVAKSLALLGDAKGQAPPRRVDHVREVHEHPLRRLRAQPDLRRVLLDRADERLEHEVELPRCSEDATALRAARRVGRLAARAPFIREVVLAPALFAGSCAVHERIGEAGDVPARDPYLGVHEDRRTRCPRHRRGDPPSTATSGCGCSGAGGHRAGRSRIRR